MRIALAQIIQESNTFVPFATSIDHFSAQYIRRGEEVFRGLKNTKVELTGMLSSIEAAGGTPIPLLATHGSCGGPLTRECLDFLLNSLAHELDKSLPVDGVLLALHGSMAAEDQEDCEKEILERILDCLPPNTPVGISLDLHAHVTPQLLKPNTFFVGYGAYPHTDMFETGQKTARILIDTILGKVRPKMSISKKPMIISPVNSRTTDGPMVDVVAKARELEKDTEILAVSYFMVQPWLDFEDLGFGALVCSDANPLKGQKAADTICEMVWARREELLPSLTTLEDAIDSGLKSPGVTIIGDCGDATSGGAGGDNITVLKTLIEKKADQGPALVYLTLVDAPGAVKAAKKGAGSAVKLRLGHTLSRQDGKPLEVEGIVKTITDGLFKMSAGLEGAEMNFGLTVVLAVGSLRVAIRSVSGLEWDVAQFTSVGLDLSLPKLVFVKSPSHFRATFGPYADQILTADTPGPTRVNIRKVNYKKLRRPIHPLDTFEHKDNHELL